MKTYSSPSTFLSFRNGAPPVALFKSFFSATAVGEVMLSRDGKISFRCDNGWQVVLTITAEDTAKLRDHQEIVLVFDPGYPTVEQVVRLRFEAVPLPHWLDPTAESLPAEGPVLPACITPSVRPRRVVIMEETDGPPSIWHHSNGR